MKKLTPWRNLPFVDVRLRIELKWADAWVGVYVSEPDLWVCLIPCFPLHFQAFYRKENHYPKPRRLYNLTQQLRAFLGLPPLDNYCDESAPGETFLCAECGYLRPWSRGAWDDMEAVCDHCWAEHERNGEVL